MIYLKYMQVHATPKILKGLTGCATVIEMPTDLEIISISK